MQSLIVENQGVDAVTSATAENTIPAIKKAYADCIQQALIVKTEEPAKEEGFSFEKTEFGTPLWLVPELGMFQWREKPETPTQFERTESADVIVVGKFEGDAALAAVGAPGSLINLLVNLFLGLSVGANVVAALSVSLFGMFLAIIMPEARKSRVVLACVAAGFV